MKKFAPFLIIIAGICWGAIGIFVRKLNSFGIQSLEIVDVRAIVSAFLIGVLLLVYNKKLLYIHPRHLWTVFGTGVAGIIFFNLCYFSTIKASSLSVAAVLLYTAPIFVMLLSSLLFKERITKKKVFCLGLSLIGCVMVSGIFDGTATLDGKGFVVGLGAGLGYALYTIFTRYALIYGEHPLTIQFYTFLFGAIGGYFISDIEIIKLSVMTYGSGPIVFILGIGIFCTAIPNVLYNYGLKYVDNGTTSIMASVEPAMAIIFGIIFFHEIPSPVAAIGMIFSLTSIILINRNKKN